MVTPFTLPSNVPSFKNDALRTPTGTAPFSFVALNALVTALIALGSLITTLAEAIVSHEYGHCFLIILNAP